MKKNSFIVFLIFLSLQLNAQKWEIKDHGIKIEKKAVQLVLSCSYMDAPLVIEADTVYQVNWYESYLIFRTNGKLGMINPSDMNVIMKPRFEFLNHFDGEVNFILAKENNKLSLLDAETLKPLFNEKFDKVQVVDSTGYYYDWYLVENNGKKGIINIQERYFFIKMVYDDIIFESTERRDIRFLVRKGKKYGIGDCEALVLDAKYDEIKLFMGDCGNASYIVKKGKKYGITKGTYRGYPIVFDKISFVGKKWPYGYMILEKKGRFDVIDDGLKDFEPRFDKVWTEIKDKKETLYMSKDGEVSTINL